MRRRAGGHLRYKRTVLHLLLAAGGGIIIGLWLGYVLHQVMGTWLDGVWPSIAVGAAMLLIIAAFWIAFRSLERGRLQRLEKGEDAEVRTGQTIEYAITAPHCAIAHTVTDIARVGDIDHLVVTPVRLWVIETKYRRVPREQFPEVLRRIADNTAVVREWAPPGTPVRACLVLAYGKRPGNGVIDTRGGRSPRSGVQVRSAGVSRVGSSASTSPSDWARGSSVNTRRR